MSPEGVSIHVARMRLVEVTPESLKEMVKDSVKAAEDLATAEVDIIVYGCTSGVLLEGPEWERNLVQLIQSRSGIRTITTAYAVIEALKALSARKIVVATPYIEELNIREKRFLEDSGVEVLNIKGLGIVKNIDIGKQSPWTAYQLVKKVFVPQANAVFINCTNFRTIEILDILEKDLRRPVISSNSASIWLALRKLGIGQSIKGYGILLESKL